MSDKATSAGLLGREMQAVEDRNYGTRHDGTPKASGYFGELGRPDGNISTELSIGVNIDGKEIEIPTLVPTLTEDERDSLLAGGEITREVVDKAVSHALSRMREGASPFSQGGYDR